MLIEDHASFQSPLLPYNVTGYIKERSLMSALIDMSKIKQQQQ